MAINKLDEMELQDIEDIMEEIKDMKENEEKERFKIDNLNSANWAFRKLAAIESKRQEIKDLANKEIERIKHWQDKEERALNNSKEFFESLLTEHFVTQREVDPKFQISTPYGKVSSRKQQPKWNYDNDKVIDWLEVNDPDMIRVKKEPSKTDIKKKYDIAGDKVVTEDGEVVEGISIEERPDSITVKVAE